MRAGESTRENGRGESQEGTAVFRAMHDGKISDMEVQDNEMLFRGMKWSAGDDFFDSWKGKSWMRVQ